MPRFALSKPSARSQSGAPLCAATSRTIVKPRPIHEGGSVAGDPLDSGLDPVILPAKLEDDDPDLAIEPGESALGALLSSFE
jgi:hypothetical protein